MIKKFKQKFLAAYVLTLGIMALLIMGRPLKAQTLQFSMEIQPELGIEVLQNLNFGTVVTNSGTHKIALGDPQVGIFKLKAMNTQQALLTLDKPGYLFDVNNENQRIPVRLHAAYSKLPYQYKNAQPFSDNNLWISLTPDIPTTSSPVWENGYVYIYGDIEVGDITRGVYSGTLVLNVVYQ